MTISQSQVSNWNGSLQLWLLFPKNIYGHNLLYIFQFLEIFGLLLNESGESFNNVRAPQNISPDTPIGSFGPVVGTTQLDSEK